MKQKRDYEYYDQIFIELHSGEITFKSRDIAGRGYDTNKVIDFSTTAWNSKFYDLIDQIQDEFEYAYLAKEIEELSKTLEDKKNQLAKMKKQLTPTSV